MIELERQYIFKLTLNFIVIARNSLLHILYCSRKLEGISKDTAWGIEFKILKEGGMQRALQTDITNSLQYIPLNREKSEKNEGAYFYEIIYRLCCYHFERCA